MNCWEFKKCGRETGGSKCVELGVCPAASTTKAGGIHGGVNGGRSCWAISGTFCGGKVQGTFAQKIFNCMECDFYKSTIADEGRTLLPSREIINLLRA